MDYRYATVFSDRKRIDRLNKLTNPDTFWDDIHKITRNLSSLTVINGWEYLAKIRYRELTENDTKEEN